MHSTTSAALIVTNYTRGHNRRLAATTRKISAPAATCRSKWSFPSSLTIQFPSTKWLAPIATIRTIPQIATTSRASQPRPYAQNVTWSTRDRSSMNMLTSPKSAQTAIGHMALPTIRYWKSRSLSCVCSATQDITGHSPTRARLAAQR